MHTQSPMRCTNSKTDNDNCQFGLHPEWPAFEPVFDGFQGCPIEEAEIVIVGKDANWPVCIGNERFTKHQFFKCEVKPFLKDYHKWLKRPRNHSEKGKTHEPQIAIHHPLLALSHDARWEGVTTTAPSAGKFYHSRVRRLFCEKLSDRIASGVIGRTCFVELLPRPTAGNSGRSWNEYRKFLEKHAAEHIAKRLTPQLLRSKRRRIVFLALGGELAFQELKKVPVLKQFLGSLDFNNGYPCQKEPLVPVDGRHSSSSEIWASYHISSRFNVTKRMAEEIEQFMKKRHSSR